MLSRVYFFLIFIGFSFELICQNYSTSIIKFDENDGFKVENYIGDVKSDSEGNIWIVDFNQINRYDGIQFKTIEPGKVNHNALLRFIEGDNGRKLVFDYSGMLFYVEGDTLVPSEYNEQLKTVKTNSNFTDVKIDTEGKLHISFNNSGYLIVDSNSVSKPLDSLPKNIKGEVLILYNDGSTFTTFSTKTKQEAEKIYVLNESLTILDSIRISKKEYNYPSSKTRFNHDVFYYSNGQGDYFEINRSGKIKHHEYEYPIINLFSDRYGSLWISTFENGLYRIDKSNQEEYSLFFPNTTTVLATEDIEGGLWAHSYEEGLLFFPHPNYYFLNQDVDAALPDNIYALGQDQESIFIASSSDALVEYNYYNQETKLRTLPTQEFGVITSIFKDTLSNILWLSKKGKIFYQFEESWNSFKTKKLPGFNSKSSFKVVGFDTETNNNIGIYNNRYVLFSDTLINYVSPQFEDKVVDVCKLENIAYVGTESGVYSQNGIQLNFLGDKFSVLKEMVHSITEFNNELYFALYKRGLYRYGDNALTPVSANGVTIENALVYKKNEDSLWVLGNQGSFLFEKNGNVSGFEKLPKTLSSRIVMNDYGVFWGTIKKGVFCTPFSSLVSNKLTPVKLKLNAIKLNGNKLSLTDSLYQVAYNKNIIQIDYQTISFKDWPIKYRHRMLGLNDDWVVSTEKGIQFTNLPIGEYVFELQAKKGEEAWSSSISKKFVVLPPIWRKWWFITISLALLALIVYLIFSYRFKVVKREKDLVIDKLKAEQRALRAQMDPHFVFNIVASAQYLVLKEENEKAIEFLNMFSSLMRSILDYSNSNLITLEQELKFINDYISLEHFRLEHSFNYKINIDKISTNLADKIPPFIIQPFIENSIHHGLKNKDGAKELTISFLIENSFLIVKIKDSGIGRKNAGKFISEEKRKRKSHGIRIIKERLQLHNNREKGNIVYSDPEEGGTSVTVKIKIDQI